MSDDLTERGVYVRAALTDEEFAELKAATDFCIDEHIASDALISAARKLGGKYVSATRVIDAAMLERGGVALVNADAAEPYNRVDGRWRPAVLAEAVLRAALNDPQQIDHEPNDR